MDLKGRHIGLALTGSHCTIPLIWPAVEELAAAGAELYPILSPSVAGTDTRFGTAAALRERLVGICGREPWLEIPEVEPIGPKKLLDLMLVIPCTGNTLAKLAHGISDNAVTMACKSQLRNGRPVLLAISTNDGLSGNAPNLGALLGRKHYFFVPFGQDSPENKPHSLLARLSFLALAVEAALADRQLEPMLVQNSG